MRSAIVCGLAVWLVSPWAVAAPRPKDPKKDPPTLVGGWITPFFDQQPQQYVFEADGQFTYVFGAFEPVKYTYTVDPKKNPAEINLTRKLKD